MDNILNIVNPSHIGYTGSLRNSGDEAGDAWFTPKEWVERFRYILGGIELDQFSSEDANRNVQAQRYFTKENSAFHQLEWRAKTVFMNPPYSRGLCDRAIRRLISEFDAGRVGRALVLVNNMTDTQWWHIMAANSERICFLEGRIAFMSNDNKRISGNTRGQNVFLLLKMKAPNVRARFERTLAPHGIVVARSYKGFENG